MTKRRLLWLLGNSLFLGGAIIHQLSTGTVNWKSTAMIDISVQFFIAGLVMTFCVLALILVMLIIIERLTF